MEKQLHGNAEAAYVERTTGTQESSPGREKEKSHKHRGIFNLHHHSKDEKDEEKKKEGSKREKIAAAMVGLGATLKKIKHPRHGGGGKEEGGAEEGEEGGEEEEEEEEEEDEGDDGGDEEGGGKFSAFISMIAEAFEDGSSVGSGGAWRPVVTSMDSMDCVAASGNTDSVGYLAINGSTDRSTESNAGLKEHRRIWWYVAVNRSSENFG